MDQTHTAAVGLTHRTVSATITLRMFADAFTSWEDDETGFALAAIRLVKNNPVYPPLIIEACTRAFNRILDGQRPFYRTDIEFEDVTAMLNILVKEGVYTEEVADSIGVIWRMG